MLGSSVTTAPAGFGDPPEETFMTPFIDDHYHLLSVMFLALVLHFVPPCFFFFLRVILYWVFFLYYDPALRVRDERASSWRL